MQQERWVSYIFRYRNGQRCENAGFIKVQRLSCRHGDEARIQIGLRLMKERPCKCQVYMLLNHNKAKYLTDIDFKARERDTIMKRVEIPWAAPFGDAAPFNAYDGLLFVCEDGEQLAGLWHEHPLDADNISVICETEEKAEDTPKLSEKPEKVKDISEQKKTNESGYSTEAEDAEKEYNDKASGASTEEENCTGENICARMLATYPRLPLLGDSQLLECVKIVPQDIGKLSMGNWRLGVNSFLSHGYYHYRYIMLGRVKLDDDEIYVVGVPGVFTNKEKYLANMFGFNLFVPARKTNYMTGKFGYWISEVSQV